MCGEGSEKDDTVVDALHHEIRGDSEPNGGRGRGTRFQWTQELSRLSGPKVYRLSDLVVKIGINSSPCR